MSRGHFAAAVLAATLALAAPSAASASSLSFPLVGWWPMNEGSGQTVKDWSGKGNHGFLGSTPQADANDPSWIRGVLLGSGLRFGGGQYVTVPASSSLEQQKLTVAAWVRGESSPGAHRYVVSKGSLECLTGSYGLYTGADGGIAFYIADGPSHYFASPAAPTSVWDGKWHHVAGTFDGSTVRLYVDGKQVGSGTPAPATIDYSLPGRDGQFGGYAGDCSQDLTFTGDVDGVQIWSQAIQVDKVWLLLKAIVNLAR